MNASQLQLCIDALNNQEFKGIQTARAVLETAGAIEVVASRMKEMGFASILEMMDSFNSGEDDEKPSEDGSEK